jgi:hypothetical protein
VANTGRVFGSEGEVGMRGSIIAAALLALGASQDPRSNNETFRNPSGRAGTVGTQGAIDLTSEY